jgi:Domain of unknown function (DUF4129)
VAKTSARQSLADYVTIALSPLLIMALIGSLVFFLLEVFYGGQYMGRMQWTFFFFIFGMVLVSRVSIELGSARARIYGAFLAIVVFLALESFMQFEDGTPLAPFAWLINLGLIALISWCASKLTWDCTYIDDKIDASGKGVLEAAGLDLEAPEEEDQSEEADGSPDDAKKGSSRRANSAAGLMGWWSRYREYSSKQAGKPHTPGVWVVYFSLAALPLYGLGQALIPVEETDRRHYAFWLMVCYVASGLGLLVTTSFLGLRRYLRQRKLRMPVSMAATWLLLASAMILVLLVAGALMPRPYGEYQLISLSAFKTKERSASRYALKRSDAGKGQGSASEDPAKEDQKAEPGSGTKAGNDGSGKSPNKTGNQSGQSGSKAGKSNGGKKSGGKQSQSKNSSSSRAGQQGTDSPDQQDKDGSAKTGEESKEQKEDSESSGQKESDRQGSGQDRSSGKGSQFLSHNPVGNLFSKLGPLGRILKWIVFGVVALIVVFYLARSGLRFLANFTDWARRLLDSLRAWWQSLFGGNSDDYREEESQDAEYRPPPRPFADFRNPFLDGNAERLTPNELVRYSFDALQAWAWERDLARRQQETPLEFAARLVDEVPALEAPAQRMASLYARVAYARSRLGPGTLDVLRSFWDRLEAVEERPLSA